MNFKLLLIVVFSSFYVNSQTYYSQFGQDKYAAEKLFNFKKSGVFFDIGAYDGITTSNSYFFEKNLGWTGVCVEPQIERFKQLEKIRNCICINGCVYKESGIKKFLKVNGPIEGYSGLYDTYDIRHKEAIDRLLSAHGGTKNLVDIQTFTFNEICEKNNIKKIDFLSVDTEGSEEQILRSIDFKNINIDVITVENNYDNPNIKKFLKKIGYEYLCRLGVDEFYRKVK